MVRCPLSINVRDIPEIDMTVGQISTLFVVSDVIVRRIDRPPVRVAFGVIIEELILVGAVTCGMVGGANQVSTSGLVSTDVGGQYEWARSEKPLVRVVKSCLPRIGLGIESCVVHVQRVGELIDGPREPIVGGHTSARRDLSDSLYKSVVQVPLGIRESEILRPNNPVLRATTTDDLGLNPELSRCLGNNFHTTLDGGKGVGRLREWFYTVRGDFPGGRVRGRSGDNLKVRRNNPIGINRVVRFC